MQNAPPPQRSKSNSGRRARRRGPLKNNHGVPRRHAPARVRPQYRKTAAADRAPSYRQAYQGYRNGEDVGGRGAVHAIRAATYMSGGLATPHGSAAQFKRVSSVNLLATSLEHATELYDELERLDSQLKISGLLSGCVGVAATANFLNGYHTSVMNSAEATALPGHSLVAWSVAVAALPLAGAPGSFIGGWLAEGRRLGRDGCLWFVGFVYWWEARPWSRRFITAR